MMLGFTFGIGYALSVFVGWLGDYIGLQNSLVIWIFSTMILATAIILRVKENALKSNNLKLKIKMPLSLTEDSGQTKKQD